MEAFVTGVGAGVGSSRKNVTADRSTRRTDRKVTVVMATKTRRQFDFMVKSEEAAAMAVAKERVLDEADKPFVFDPNVVVLAEAKPEKKTYSALDFMDLRRRAPAISRIGGTQPERYMAATIAKQYKAMTMQGGGIYSTQCTEGTVKGAADVARVRALDAQLRSSQQSIAMMLKRKYEVRKQAVASAHGCHHEEKMFLKYNGAAETYLAKKPEALRACSRYVPAANEADQYMSASVENQMKAKALPFGIYTVKCGDGAWKDHSESARIAVNAARFRSAQQSTLMQERAKYNSRQNALANYTHGCDYEEQLFLKFPRVAASMGSAFDTKSVVGQSKPKMSQQTFRPVPQAVKYSPSGYVYRKSRPSIYKSYVDMSSPSFQSKGPIGKKADEYMAAKITQQYKAMTMQGGGIYSTQCTEGTTKGAADIARVRVLSSQFKMNQLPIQEKLRLQYETRKVAVANAHGCHHEEKMFSAFNKSAETYTIKKAEAMLACNRYVIPTDSVDLYMAESVEKQMKMRAVSTGVYSVKCSDGAWKDHSESARIATLATEFRRSQQPALLRERAKYNARQFAVANFAHGCDHEEQEFINYPSMAASMRGPGYGQ